MTMLSSGQNSSVQNRVEHSGYNGENSLFRGTTFDFRGYLENREGQVWRRCDTLKVLSHAEQMDALVVQLMRAAGVEIVE